MANQYRSGNQRNEESNPCHNAVYLRLFGSNIRIINGGPRSVSSIPVIGGQTELVARSDYQRSGVVAGNSSNVNSISSFNEGINTTATGTRNDELFRANSLFKRSRSPDPFTRGETSNQGSQAEGSSSRRRTLPSPTIAPAWPSSFVPPQQPIMTSDASPSNNYRLNPHLSLGSGLTIATQTDHYIHTGSGSPRSENVASHGGIHHNLISTSHELRSQRNRPRAEMIEWRLREEVIFLYIKQKTYRPNTEETSTMNQTCTICQEDYIDGEHIGRLHCTHRYHFDCIEQWLGVKNVCPICKEPAQLLWL